MKKLFLLLIALFFGASAAHALMPEELTYAPISSYTDANTNGNMLFTSATIHIIGVTISSPGTGNSSLTFYRSTSPAWTPDVSTQAFIWTDYAGNNGGPQYVDMFGMKNASYTHINKNGNAKLIIWVQCPKPSLRGNEVGWGFCPGLSYSGQNGPKIEWPR